MCSIARKRVNALLTSSAIFFQLVATFTSSYIRLLLVSNKARRHSLPTKLCHDLDAFTPRSVVGSGCTPSNRFTKQRKCQNQLDRNRQFDSSVEQTEGWQCSKTETITMYSFCIISFPFEFVLCSLDWTGHCYIYVMQLEMQCSTNTKYKQENRLNYLEILGMEKKMKI